MNLGRDLLFGIAIGDALGLPVEFKDRTFLRNNPVQTMTGYGTHNQPKGTWSDDSSLTFCLAESLADHGYDLMDISERILDWFHKGYWTPYGTVFDIGRQTRNAIDELTAIFKHKTFQQLEERRNDNEYSNGNGALMRILPLSLETIDLPPDQKMTIIQRVTALTHGHIRSTIASLIYILYAEQIIEGHHKWQAYLNTKRLTNWYLSRFHIPSQEVRHFVRILDFNISDLPESSLASDGYVVHSLELCFWSLLRHNNFKDTVLAAVNLGGDTDTNAAITGGLAGLIYQVEGMPEEWKETIVKKAKIEQLADRLYDQYYE
ncbi:MAG: hypothetical protein F6K19_02870 [Cyanothece sp. SIO1E1]|nr:hypothetical protein [Cyanothece sp. SIO1E1]